MLLSSLLTPDTLHPIPVRNPKPEEQSSASIPSLPKVVRDLSRLLWLGRLCLKDRDLEKREMKNRRYHIQLVLGAILTSSLLLSDLFATGRVLTPHNVAKIRTVTGAEISPDFIWSIWRVARLDPL